MLTGVNLLLRAVGTSFHVYLSRHVGAAGIGLLQLVMSVGNLAMVAGIAGIRTATMYLTAEELGKGQPQNVSRILSSCFLYSILCSSVIGAGLFFGAPMLAEHWIGNQQTIPARADTSLLRTMESAGIAAPAHCRSGECGWCHSRLVAGEVYTPKSVDGRREADLIYGYIHPCCAFPLSDLTIEVPPVK